MWKWRCGLELWQRRIRNNWEPEKPGEEGVWEVGWRGGGVHKEGGGEEEGLSLDSLWLRLPLSLPFNFLMSKSQFMWQLTWFITIKQIAYLLPNLNCTSPSPLRSFYEISIALNTRCDWPGCCESSQVPQMTNFHFKPNPTMFICQSCGW